MRSRIVFGAMALAVLAVLFMPAQPVPAQDSDAAFQVGVVVVGADGRPRTFCVTLSGSSATGVDALNATGLAVVVENSTMGTTVCRLESDGCAPPEQSCFCQCEGGESCAYWSYFRLGKNDTWEYSALGAAASRLAHGDVDGWWWRDSSQVNALALPVIPFEAICLGEPPFPRVVTDGLGREVHITEPPRRIASVTLGSDEMLLALAGPERLLGVTYFASDPAISNVAEQLDGILHIDLSGSPEYLISLNADLIILAAYNNPAALEQLVDAGEPVFVLGEFKSLDDIRANIRLLGRAIGEEWRAEALIAQMDARLEAVRSQVAGQAPVRVLYYEPGGITYGPGSTVDEIITLAGGLNVVAELGLGAYPLVNPEFVLTADPDVVLLGGWFSETADPVRMFSADAAFGTLRAVRAGRVYLINDAHMTNVSQYFVLGVEDVARALYPAIFDEEGSNAGSHE